MPTSDMRINRISDKKAWRPLQEYEAIFSKNYFPEILNRIFEKLRLCVKIAYSSE